MKNQPLYESPETVTKITKESGAKVLANRKELLIALIKLGAVLLYGVGVLLCLPWLYFKQNQVTAPKSELSVVDNERGEEGDSE